MKTDSRPAAGREWCPAISGVRLAGLALCAGLALALTPFQAQAVPCAIPGLDNGILANDGCQVGSTNNDTLVPLQVNTDAMFGFSDWVFAEKWEFGEGAEEQIDIGLIITGDAQSGTWSINDIWDLVDNVMLVLKGGASDNTSPNMYVGYLLVDGDTSGTYETPFINTRNENPKDISHISAYFRGAQEKIPEPTTLGLLGLALAALSIGVRRAYRAA